MSLRGGGGGGGGSDYHVAEMDCSSEKVANLLALY